MKILGISGKRFTGKSSLARFLEEFGYMHVSLATPLKNMCKTLYGLTTEQVNGIFKEQPTHYRKPKGGFYTPRDIMILEGCLKRSIDPNFWCKKLEDSYLNWISDNTTIVIDDIRFINEIEYFKKIGAKFIRIERECGKPPLNDSSETELDNYKDWDALLLPQFNRNLDDLRTFAGYIAETL